MITVFYTRISHLLKDADFAHYLAQLPEPIQKRISAYKDEYQQQLRLAGKLLLKAMIEDKAPHLKTDDLRYSDYNRPYFPGAHFDFNISHSGDLAVCAYLENGHIGIDVEAIKPTTLLRDLFTDIEWELLNSDPEHNRLFFELWTKKEAVQKANGTGISDDMKTIEVYTNEVWAYNNHWYLYPIPIDDNYCCYAASNLCDQAIVLREFRFP